MTKHRKTHSKEIREDQQTLEEVQLTSEEFGSGKPVWNIVSTETGSETGFVSAETSSVSGQEFVSSSSQIIYIAYDTNDKDEIVHILDHTLVKFIQMTFLLVKFHSFDNLTSKVYFI